MGQIVQKSNGRLIFECQFLNFPTQKYNEGKSLQSEKLLLCQFRIHAGVPGDTMQYYTTGSRSIQLLSHITLCEKLNCMQQTKNL